MALTITRTPNPVSLTSSPVLFEAETTLYGEKDFLKLNLRIEKWTGGQWVFVGTKTLSPNLAAKSLFDISNYLSSEINSAFTWPSTGIIVQHLNARVIFRVAIWESYYEAGQIVNVAETYSQQYWAIKGGISLELEAQLNDFGTNFHTEWLEKGKFLTWMPRTIDVGANMPVKLYFLALPGIGYVIRLRYAVYRNGAWTEGFASYATATTGTVYEINVGPLALDAFVYNGDKYKVWLMNESGEDISEVFTFNIDRNSYPRNTYLLFKNSFNAYDTLWCKGLQNKQHKFKSTRVERSRALDITGADPTRVTHRNERETQYNLNTGIVKSEPVFDWMAEFFGSDKIFLLETNYAWNIQLQSESYSGINDFRQPRSVNFTFTKGFTEQYHGAKLADISPEATGGEFNFDYSDDYNVGSNDTGNTTPPDGQVVGTEFRCVVNANGVNTGEQERRYLLADGAGGTVYGEWVNVGNNLLACPLPPSGVSLQLVEETSTTLTFRAVVDRNAATEDYTVYLNKSVTVPATHPGLTNTEATAQIPASLVISAGQSASNTVTINKALIYVGGTLTVAIASVSPAWLNANAGTIQSSGTMALPLLIGLDSTTFEDFVTVKVVATSAVPQNVLCQITRFPDNTSYPTTITTGNSQQNVAVVNTLELVFPAEFILTSVPEGYWISENNNIEIGLG